MRILLIAILFVLGRAAVNAETAQEIIDRIQAQIGQKWRADTVDTFKAGSPSTPITGIATTFSATLDVLERAASSGCNLVISHEPTFYNHLDDVKALQDDPVYRAKIAFINEHHMVVWRFHDYWHSRQPAPDGIMEGMMAVLGWSNFQDPKTSYLFTFPETTLGELASHIKSSLSIRTMRVVGDPNMKLTRIAFLPGAAGEERQIKALERDDVEALVVGESREWETVEYARDAVTEKRRKALIVMGHLPSEESGMDYCAKWLRSFIKAVPVLYIPAREPFWSPQ